MATLYELTDQYRTLLDMLQDSECDEQTIVDTMEGIDVSSKLRQKDMRRLSARCLLTLKHWRRRATEWKTAATRWTSA